MPTLRTAGIFDAARCMQRQKHALVRCSFVLNEMTDVLTNSRKRALAHMRNV